ncbi:MAG: PKD domain-containing protein, partial [Desulfosalsimonadaceae bacterium]|nr:PKD domain-containing protein [Desulfosalsimonadaceae bacterium]
TEIIEYATVYFPSVPQMLNTESAVAVVCLTPPPQEPPCARPGGPYVGKTGIQIPFYGGGSYDPDGRIVKYEWDWNGDGAYDQKTTHPSVSHKWNEPASGQVGLRVTDNDGLTNEASADLLVQDNRISVYVDINPGVCPNLLNLNGKGEFSVAIPGTGTFNVKAIDPSTIRLLRSSVTGDFSPVCWSCVPGALSPLFWSYKDTATPFPGQPCGCHSLKKDGRIDLVLKFDARKIIHCLGLKALSNDSVELMITGNLKKTEGGIPFTGRDCVQLIKK